MAPFGVHSPPPLYATGMSRSHRRVLIFARLALAGLLTGSASLAAAPPRVYPVAVISADRDQGAGKVRVSALLLGGWGAGRWQAPAAVVPQLGRNRTWQAHSLGTSERLLITGGPVQSPGEPCLETVFLDMVLPASAPKTTGREFLLVTSPEMKVRPRPVVALPNETPVYRELVRSELVRRGLKSPVVNINSVTRSDLDGDGTQEVIIEASHFKEQASGTFYPPPAAEAGDYSLLLLRWVKNGQLRTTVLAQNVYTRTPTQTQIDAGEGQVPSRYGVAGVGDLNGDGRMELVLANAYYEGEGMAVLEWSASTGAKERLNEGCGA